LIHWLQNDVLYIGFVNKEADESSKKATGYRTKDGKPDVYYAAFFRAVVSSNFAILVLILFVNITVLLKNR
jgi:hypothetical protein